MIRLLLPLLIACGTDPKESSDDVSVADPATTGLTGTTDTGTTDTGTTDTGTTDTGTDTGETQGDLVISGLWVDNWGSSHTISSVDWISDASSYAITQYDNDSGYVIAQNGSSNAWNPGLWSRFDWGWLDGELVYCQTAYAAATEAEALATPAADLSSPASGCGSFSWSILRSPLSITDSWDDAWGGSHQIDAFHWWMGDSDFAITEANEKEQWLIAQNGMDNAWNPGLWSRFDWSWNGDLYYCQTAYAAATEAEARSTPAADPSNLASGCGGFSWTAMRPALSIDGTWDDNWGGSHSINAFTWTSGTSSYAITQANDTEGWLIAQNVATNPWSPNLWSRFDWTWDTGGTLWFCQTAYAASTEAEALATPAADPTDPANGGCGGFSWSSLAAP